jgi:hypothetical protein
MSYRTWLKDVTHLNDIAPWETTLDILHPEEEKMEAVRLQKFWSHLEHHCPVDDESKKYFCSKLHDSQFLGISTQKSTITVSINDIAAEVAVYDIYKYLLIERPHIPIPVDVIFEDTVYFTSLRYDPTFKLIYDNIASLKPCLRQFEMNFLYDWFFEEGGRIQWVAQVNSGKVGRKLSYPIFILIDCARAKAVDRRLPALKKLFGPNIVPLWNDYLNHVDFPEPFSDYPVHTGGFIDYFSRRLPVHGLTWNDLKFQNP